jgi:hypothetical protein
MNEWFIEDPSGIWKIKKKKKKLEKKKYLNYQLSIINDQWSMINSEISFEEMQKTIVVWNYQVLHQ